MSAERILIVDDDPLNVKLSSFLLLKEGYEVQTASDGLQGLATASSFRPQLILTDIQLPLVDGLEMTRRLKADPSNDAVIIALTAYAMKGDEELAIEAGCDDFLTKPLDTRRLPGIIRQHLDHQKSHQSSKTFAEAVSSSTTTIGVGHVVVDIEEFRTRVGGDRSLMGELISLFLTESPKLAEATRTAALENNSEALRTAAHAFKGSVATFSAPRAYQAAAVLEKMGAGGDLSGAMKAFTDLDIEVAALCSELSKIVGEVAYS